MQRVSGTVDFVLRTRIYRINLITKVVDPLWQREVEGLAEIQEIRPEALWLVSTAPTSSNLSGVRTQIHRIALDTSAATGWTRDLAGVYPVKAQVDSLGRVYLVAERASVTLRGYEIYRLSVSGELDPSWAGTASTEILPYGSRPTATLANDKLLLLTHTEPTAATPIAPRLLLLGETGTVVAARTLAAGPNYSKDSPLRFAASRSVRVVLERNRLARLSPSTLATESESGAVPIGDTPSIGFLRLPQGGFAVDGTFSGWFDGQEVRDFLLLRADGTRDSSVRLPSATADQRIEVVGVTPTEEFVLRVDKTNASEAPTVYVIDSRTSSQRSFPLVPVAGATVGKSTTGKDGWLYAAEIAPDNSVTIRRTSLATGVKDASWRAALQDTRLLTRSAFVGSLATDANGGLWISLDAPFGAEAQPPEGFLRLRIAEPNTPATVIASEQNANYFASGQLFLSAVHAYTGTQRYTLDSVPVIDATWKTNQIPSFVDNRYAYFLMRKMTQAGFVGTEVLRADLKGSGILDSNWTGFLDGAEDRSLLGSGPNGELYVLGTQNIGSFDALGLAIFVDPLE